MKIYFAANILVKVANWQPPDKKKRRTWKINSSLVHPWNKKKCLYLLSFSFSLSLFVLLFQICKPTQKISGDQIKLISIINSVDNTKLPCYTLPPMQHQSFFRNLPSLFIYLLVQYVSGVRKKLISGKLSTCTLEYPECHGIWYAVAFEHIT